MIAGYFRWSRFLSWERAALNANCREKESEKLKLHLCGLRIFSRDSKNVNENFKKLQIWRYKSLTLITTLGCLIFEISHTWKRKIRHSNLFHNFWNFSRPVFLSTFYPKFRNSNTGFGRPFARPGILVEQPNRRCLRGIRRMRLSTITQLIVISRHFRDFTHV